MKITYIYYPGAVIALIIFILNLTNLTNIDNIWIILSLWLGWICYIKNSNLPDETAVVIWFPLIKKLLKNVKK